MAQLNKEQIDAMNDRFCRWALTEGPRMIDEDGNEIADYKIDDDDVPTLEEIEAYRKSQNK